MDFFDLIDKRRSIRKFSNESVPEEVIIKDKHIIASVIFYLTTMTAASELNF